MEKLQRFLRSRPNGIFQHNEIQRQNLLRQRIAALPAASVISDDYHAVASGKRLFHSLRHFLQNPLQCSQENAPRTCEADAADEDKIAESTSSLLITNASRNSSIPSGMMRKLVNLVTFFMEPRSSDSACLIFLTSEESFAV